MDYVVGDVAALISGNVTPSRPKRIKKASTPIKHQPSPHITPKGELLDDRSILLSPSLQKRRDVVKKSPKRIFDAPDLDVTNEDVTDKMNSPKIAKVKKHLKTELGEDLNDVTNKSKPDENLRDVSRTKVKHIISVSEDIKKNKLGNVNNELDEIEISNQTLKSKKKKRLNKSICSDQVHNENLKVLKYEQKKIKKHNKNKQGKSYKVNPNAITQKDSDSDHDSDDNIQSESEANNEIVLNACTQEDISTDEEKEIKKHKNVKPERKVFGQVVNNDDDKRTLFIGNVPFTPKCKKEIKKIFNVYGTIESVRIRAVPVKDPGTSPKLAVIKNELHPDRSTVNVYVKYKDPTSIDKALVENNRVVREHHLRVSRSDAFGAEHDPHKALFVGNVPFALEDEELRATFEKCGHIESVRIIRDRKTNVGKGFAYVNFASKDGVELALSLPEEELNIKNRLLRVKRCMHSNKKKFDKRTDRNDSSVRKDSKNFGAFRRITNKRKHQDSNTDGSPRKQQKNIQQPPTSGKVREEFVGVTAEKKKKKRIDRGHKKKKMISEILTK